ncbi:hypothetical protein ACOSP7_007174 [Xanthoceras sorbifolium]|uniref:Uncharacterized protein n=1 Tax=Xanthoceras sorbifolium TaxID=99658 RepID=A0ABQ8IAM6_9ROSI|nr:hypothetical protein JRO89_XS03G0156200 [Xanthoceras sorbifolium]
MENNIGDRNHVSIEITPIYERLVSSIRGTMERAASEGCICKVSCEEIRRENLKAYVPDKVSIGPIHRNDEVLKAMEDQKWRYLYALVNRKPNQLEESLNACVDALMGLEPKARLFYKEDVSLHRDEFVKMMLVDGGFIIELFLKSTMKGLKRRNDPIFSTPGLLWRIRCNLIMLENQLPFFILQEIFRIVPIPKQCKYSITDLALVFFKSMIPGDHQLHKEKYSQESNHLLDLVYHCYLPTIPRIQVKENPPYGFRGPATYLKESGIKLSRARRRVENLLDIKFNKGVLEIPTIHIHHFTEILFRNFIAFEQCPCHDNINSLSVRYISSYVVLMKSLIDSDKEAKFLDQQDILLTDDNVDEKDVHQLFERLSRSALKNSNIDELKDFYFDGLCEQVNRYKTWRCWKTKKSSGSSSSSSSNCQTTRKKKKKEDAPWTLLFVAAILLLALTFFGTLFSILSFFLRH